jgi:hypothetical protein
MLWRPAELETIDSTYREWRLLSRDLWVEVKRLVRSFGARDRKGN